MNKHQYICKITEVVASKSTCPRDKVGAVFVNEDFEILATGYNGAPRGIQHCQHDKEAPCLEAIHAEQNAIIQAAKRGTALKGSILYCTRTPCKACAMMLANLGIKEIRFKEVYREIKHIAQYLLNTRRWDNNLVITHG